MREKKSNHKCDHI